MPTDGELDQSEIVDQVLPRCTALGTQTAPVSRQVHGQGGLCATTARLLPSGSCQGPAMLRACASLLVCAPL